MEGSSSDFQSEQSTLHLQEHHPGSKVSVAAADFSLTGEDLPMPEPDTEAQGTSKQGGCKGSPGDLRLFLHLAEESSQTTLFLGLAEPATPAFA